MRLESKGHFYFDFMASGSYVYIKQFEARFYSRKLKYFRIFFDTSTQLWNLSRLQILL
jgi:hypothetical protein